MRKLTGRRACFYNGMERRKFFCFAAFILKQRKQIYHTVIRKECDFNGCDWQIRKPGGHKSQFSLKGGECGKHYEKHPLGGCQGAIMVKSTG